MEQLTKSMEKSDLWTTTPAGEGLQKMLRECVESEYGPGTGFSIVSYGRSGVGYINHETGEVIEYVTDPGDK